MIAFYNEQTAAFQAAKADQPYLNAADFIDSNPQKISWSSSLLPQLEKGNRIVFEPEKFTVGAYRPFFKQHLYLGEKVIHRRGQIHEFFPSTVSQNLLLCVSGVGVTKDFSAILTDTLPDLELIGKSQCFPLYYYEEQAKQSPSLFDAGGDTEYVRRDGVSDFILERARRQYGKTVTKEDIFYYVYGFLHSPEYRETFSVDLKKSLPRIPLVDDVRHFWAFSKAGRALAELHVNYESVPPYPGLTVTGAESGFFTVEKMRFPQKGQKDTILYNSRITVSDIPPVAYEYVVNGKSAIEWIMERYQVTVHSESGIRNDPNDWAKEVGNPRYILDLLLSIVNVSVQTVEIVKGLPKLSF
jgi:predicted helicase